MTKQGTQSKHGVNTQRYSFSVLTSSGAKASYWVQKTRPNFTGKKAGCQAWTVSASPRNCNMQYNSGLQHHQSRLYGVQQRHSQGPALGATSYHHFHLQQQQQQAPYRHDQHPSSPQRNAPAFQSSYQEHGHEPRKLDVYLLRRQGADTQALPHTASHLPHDMIHAGSVRAQALDARPGLALSQCRSPPPSSAEQNLRRAPQAPMYSHPPGLASGPSVVQDHASERTHHTPNVLDHEREQEGDRRRQAADSERMNWLTFLVRTMGTCDRCHSMPNAHFRSDLLLV